MGALGGVFDERGLKPGTQYERLGHVPVDFPANERRSLHEEQVRIGDLASLASEALAASANRRRRAAGGPPRPAVQRVEDVLARERLGIRRCHHLVNGGHEGAADRRLCQVDTPGEHDSRGQGHRARGAHGLRRRQRLPNRWLVQPRGRPAAPP